MHTIQHNHLNSHAKKGRKKSPLVAFGSLL
jgi:hypothetical protein